MGVVDQGHIQAVAEAGAGGSFPWASPCEHPPGTFTPWSHVAFTSTDSRSPTGSVPVALLDTKSGTCKDEEGGCQLLPPQGSSPPHPSGEPGTELNASLPQPQASPRGQAEGERGKQEAEPRCSSIPAVPPAASIIHKWPSAPLLGTMSPLPCLAPSILVPSSMPGTFHPCCSPEKAAFFPKLRRESIFHHGR